ncbi:hypothetical protein PIB30_055063 [Stylosanthes scabra]|uniref:Uncharacterized protein n=1 Tax=Stylosanthes scabra TaxID=79078 RepID=A0ABU6XIQ7_9FABA|nr:hypothetical protein [Stylosanthes scabra]
MARTTPVACYCRTSESILELPESTHGPLLKPFSKAESTQASAESILCNLSSNQKLLFTYESILLLFKSTQNTWKTFSRKDHDTNRLCRARIDAYDDQIGLCVLLNPFSNHGNRFFSLEILFFSGKGSENRLCCRENRFSRALVQFCRFVKFKPLKPFAP